MMTTAHLEQILPAQSGLDAVATATAATVAATVLASAGPPARTVLSARLLGGCWVTIDHRPVPLANSRRTRALLAFLVDRPSRPVPRDVLMDVFWPDSSPDAARNSLHVAMHGLRKALAQAWDGPVIECRGDTYRLSDAVEVWSDAAELERRNELGALAAADGRLDDAVAEYETGLALYGGEFMADDPYLDWALTRREELRLPAGDCAEQLSELHLRRGELRRALAISSQVLREEPCHEPAARRLMIAYARLGQPHMALRLYERIVGLLGRELGVAAATETEALADQIRRRTPV
jgi:DNA-binding SARP family transcriptional activator